MYSALTLIKKAIDPSILAGGAGFLGGAGIGGLTGWLKSDPLESSGDRNKRIFNDVALGGGLGTATALGANAVASGNLPGMIGNAASEFQKNHPLLSGLGSFTKGESSIPGSTSLANLVSGIPGGKYVTDALSYGGAAGGLHGAGRSLKDAYNMGRINPSSDKGISGWIKNFPGMDSGLNGKSSLASKLMEAVSGNPSVSKAVDAISSSSLHGVVPDAMHKNVSNILNAFAKQPHKYPGVDLDYVQDVLEKLKLNNVRGGYDAPGFGQRLISRFSEDRPGMFNMSSSPLRTGLAVGGAELAAQPIMDLIAKALQKPVQLQ